MHGTRGTVRDTRYEVQRTRGCRKARNRTHGVDRGVVPAPEPGVRSQIVGLEWAIRMEVVLTNGRTCCCVGGPVKVAVQHCQQHGILAGEGEKVARRRGLVVEAAVWNRRVGSPFLRTLDGSPPSCVLR